jgi:diguanylate cyclase (GGDEF)-like protein
VDVLSGKETISILIVDDREENLTVLCSILERPNLNIVKATSGNEALALVLDYEFAVALLDVQMPNMDGFEMAELMRGNKKTQNIPIIFITANSKDQKCIFKGYEVGAVDYLFKPIEPIILKSKVNIFIDLYKQKKLLEQQMEVLKAKIEELTQLKEANWKLENMSMLDFLTQIPNRRNFDLYIQDSWRKAIRDKSSISIIMIDIDYFKLFNDNYGHLAGDESLVKVASSIVASFSRPGDFVARYGGEEFIVILPDTRLEGAVVIAEKIRKTVEDASIPHEFSRIAGHVTVSLGVTSKSPNKTDSIEDFINLADQAMYMAKIQGRNRVVY